VINKGSHTSQAFHAAYILLNCDKGEFSENTEIINAEICKILKVGERTIDRVKKKFVEEGFESVLERRPSIQNYTKKVDGDIEAKLVTLCCSEPPDGFHAVLMEKAKAAFLLADLLKDQELKNIATQQLEYIVGYNPFAMSTIYGEGYDFTPLYGAYAGDVAGAVPVGIETFENVDEPYMPMQVNATYKETWTHTTASTMWLLAMLFKD
jgi:hypothetical protein